MKRLVLFLGCLWGGLHLIGGVNHAIAGTKVVRIQSSEICFYFGHPLPCGANIQNGAVIAKALELLETNLEQRYNLGKPGSFISDYRIYYEVSRDYRSVDIYCFVDSLDPLVEQFFLNDCQIQFRKKSNNIFEFSNIKKYSVDFLIDSTVDSAHLETAKINQSNVSLLRDLKRTSTNFSILNLVLLIIVAVVLARKKIKQPAIDPINLK